MLALAALTLAGCGVHPVTLPQARAIAPHAIQARDYSGAYLALDFNPTPELASTSDRLLQQLHFVDLTHALPPRSGDEFHVTIGYFQHLSTPQAAALNDHFNGQSAELAIDGYGVANNQAAYFTVRGVEEARQVLQGLKIPYSADDAHVTFGVSPDNPRDVHNVPKKAQAPVGPFKFTAQFHLMQGPKKVW